MSAKAASQKCHLAEHLRRASTRCEVIQALYWARRAGRFCALPSGCDDQTHYYELSEVNKKVLAESHISHVGGGAVTQQQMAKLADGPGATVSEWPTIGVIIEDPVSKAKAKELLEQLLGRMQT